MKIVLLGSGNVATHLGRAFRLAGQDVVQVWSRNVEHANALADTIGAEAIADLDDVSRKADLYIISVKDEAISSVAAGLKLDDKLLVHTSGSVELGVLDGHSSKIGVFYPLQTFSKVKAVDFRQIPIAIESNSAESLNLIRSIADRLSEKVVEMDSVQRRTLHVAAVFACNFTNHLYAIAKDLMTEKGLDFDLLRPLIAETADKVKLNPPAEVQTGPASREDHETMDAHLKELAPHPDWQELYRKLSQSIVNLPKQS